MMIERVPTMKEIEEFRNKKKKKKNLIPRLSAITRLKRENLTDSRVSRRSIKFNIDDDSDSHESKESDDDKDGKVTKKVIKFDSGEGSDDESF